MSDRNIIRVRYMNGVLAPDGHYAAAALHHGIGEGEVFEIDLNPNRTKKSHNHQFAFVHTAFDNLPEDLMRMPYAASVDDLRYHALIQCGYCHTSTMVMDSDFRAAAVARALQEADRKSKVYSLINQEGRVITRFTPESQKMKEMGRDRFQQSKQDILVWLADLIGTTPADLARTSREAA